MTVVVIVFVVVFFAGMGLLTLVAPTRLMELIAEIESDPTAIFWG